MGLDSVELIMTFEKYFAIAIPDAKAETMTTLQNATDTIAELLNISENNCQLRFDVFANIVSAISKCYESLPIINLEDTANQYLPLEDKKLWAIFEQNLLLDVPIPYATNNQSKFLFSNFPIPAPNYSWPGIPFSHFTDVICASNFHTLVTPWLIRSKYEIYIAIAGITIDRLGIDPYEIGPDKSFVKDFGID